MRPITRRRTSMPRTRTSAAVAAAFFLTFGLTACGEAGDGSSAGATSDSGNSSAEQSTAPVATDTEGQETTVDEDGNLRVTVAKGEAEIVFVQDDGEWSEDDLARMRKVVLSDHGYWTGVWVGTNYHGYDEEINHPEDSKTKCDPDSMYHHGADCVWGTSFDEGVEYIDSSSQCGLFLQFEGSFGRDENFWFVDANGERYHENATRDELHAFGGDALPCGGNPPAAAG